MAGWSDLSSAQAMRDALQQIVGESIESLRPSTRAGTVLRVFKSGPTFNVSAAGSNPDTTAPPPVSVGNPQQVYYADVRLDVGPTVRARIQQDIPFARDAAWWDGTQIQPGSTVYPYFIVDGVYRKSATVQRTDYNGATYTSIEPDMSSHVSAAPYVPPRVAVEGSAGKYVINEIIRGISGNEDSLIKNGILVGVSKGGISDLPGRSKDLLISSQEMIWFKQGWVGNTSFAAATASATGKSSSFEVELSYGNSYQKYWLNATHVRQADWGKWMMVPPIQETFTPRYYGLASDMCKNVLFAQIDTAGNLHLYVASSDVTATFFTASDLFLNGSITVRSTSGPLVQVPASMPPINLTDSVPKYVWGFTNTTGSPLDNMSEVAYARPVQRSAFSQDLINLKGNLSFGTAIANGSLSTGFKFFWDKASTYTARSVFKASGYFDILYPAVGTQIPVVSPSGTYVVNAAADGIPFDGYFSLYYALPIGNDTGQQSVDTNFILIDPNTDFDIPEHWILIASRPNVAPAAVAPPSSTVPVNVRVGAGNFHGAYSKSDSDRMAQTPYAVNLLISATMSVDIMMCSELHEENNMHLYFLGEVRKKDADWNIAEGDGGNQLLYRPSLYVVTGVNPMPMPTGRNLTDFTVLDKATGFEFHVFVTHTTADDDDGTSRDTERQKQVTFISQQVAKALYAIVGGDFNFKQDTNVSLRNILSTNAQVTGLQFRTANIPNYNRDSISGSTGTQFSGNARWPDDIFTRNDQSVTDSAGVQTGKTATDHFLWVRTTVGFLGSGTVPVPIRPGATFQLGNGREVDSWHTLTPTSGWSHATDHTLQYKRENGRVYFRGGLVANGAKSSGTNMLNIIPVGVRPVIYTFQMGWYASYTPARLDINTGGTVITRTSMDSGDQLFFDGVQYSYEK